MKKAIRLIVIFSMLSAVNAKGSEYIKTYRCYFIKSSKKFNHQGDFYYSKGTSNDTIDTLKALINKSIKKNETLWGSGFYAKPIIIYCNTYKQYLKYAGEYTAGMTRVTSINTYLILWRGGLSLDVIAHELCHAELSARLGIYNRLLLMPGWFDEGLAMQLDERDEFKWLTDTTNFYEYLKPLRGHKSFWDGSLFKVSKNYCYAKIEVANWLGPHPAEKLSQLLNGLNEGTSFTKLYENLDHRKPI
ncbi:MAG: hypothetical protein ACPGLV_05175 [Bacteroidia bacterium]